MDLTIALIVTAITLIAGEITKVTSIPNKLHTSAKHNNCSDSKYSLYSI